MDELDQELVLIEKELHKRICLVYENPFSTPEQKKQDEEQIFRGFYNELQTYRGGTKLKELTLEELKAAYYKFRESLRTNKENEEER